MTSTGFTSVASAICSGPSGSRVVNRVFVIAPGAAARHGWARLGHQWTIADASSGHITTNFGGLAVGYALLKRRTAKPQLGRVDRQRHAVQDTPHRGEIVPADPAIIAASRIGDEDPALVIPVGDDDVVASNQLVA